MPVACAILYVDLCIYDYFTELCFILSMVCLLCVHGYGTDCAVELCYKRGYCVTDYAIDIDMLGRKCCHILFVLLCHRLCY
jgi:hypothetical protein